MRWIGPLILVAACGRLSFDQQAVPLDTVGLDVPVTTTSYPMAVLASGPHSYYRLGESVDTALDASGNGHDAPILRANDGVIAHLIPGALTGDPDTALSVMGSGNVTVPDGEAYIDTRDTDPLWAGQWTTEEFVKILVAPSGRSYGLVVCEDYNAGTTGAGSGFRTGIAGIGGPVFRWWNNEANGESIIVSTVQQTGTWIHFVATRDLNGVTLYVNGVQNASGAVPDYLAPTGINAECGVGAFHGMPSYVELDEVAFYQRALSAEEIAQHYLASGR